VTDLMNPGNGDFLGGLFDFNGDGKTDISEMFIAYKIFEESTGRYDESLDDDEDEDLFE